MKFYIWDQILCQLIIEIFQNIRLFHILIIYYLTIGKKEIKKKYLIF